MAATMAPTRPHAAAAATTLPPGKRDPRLDFFRGIGMLIIFTAHMPGNWWTLWIPARFGFSDATEIFVFCSGMASAIAFGRVFERKGWPMGTARIVFRMWQVYWSHIALFLAVAVSMVWLNSVTWIEEYDYVGFMNLWFFFDDPSSQLPGLMTLTYVPNYFDILPMYLVLLALIPVVVGLKQLAGVKAAAGLIIGLWLLTQFGLMGLPAEPWSDRVWFFNPFGWGLIFFSGFFLGAGWIKAPAARPWMLWAAAAFLLVSVPFAYFRIHQNVEWIAYVRTEVIGFLIAKTEFGLFRYLHFIALAYLAVASVGPAGVRLIADGLWGGFVRMIMTVGQQSLAIFLMGMYAARLYGAALDHIGINGFTMAAANLIGWAMLIVTAYVVTWFKSQPWRDRKAALKPAQA
jgi:hypothetical protein